MMKEFYEPMLYLSTPEHPNTMSVVAELKEPIDGNILNSVSMSRQSRGTTTSIRCLIRSP